MVGSLLSTDGGFFAGANGDKGAGIYKLDGKGKATLLWSNDDVKYVWAMLAAPGGKIYAATGPNGQVWSVDAQGKGQKLFEGKDLCKNMQCLAASRDGCATPGATTRGWWSRSTRPKRPAACS